MHQSGMNHAKVNEHDLFGGHFDQGLHRQISMEAKSKKIRDRDEFAGEIDRGENTSIYATCHTIDDCMWGLHTCLESSDQVKVLGRKKICDSDYDWILDGDDSKNSDDLNESETNKHNDEIHRSGEGRRQRTFGDEALDNMLGMMELEISSFSTNESSACYSLVNGDANLDCSGRNTEDKVSADEGDQNAANFADFSVFNGVEQECALSHDDLLREDNLDSVIANVPNCMSQCQELAQKEEGNESTPTRKNETSSGYVPPTSILDLVSDLDNELNVTIEQCLASPPDASSESVDEESECPMNSESTVVAELDLIMQQHERNKNEYNQPLLMSATLLESLPIPLPNGTSDLEASFTRRIQTNHFSVVSNQPKQNIVDMEDDLLQQKLSETIHKGYFCSDGNDCDSFDSIVLDEVLNIPWPFDTIDLNEPILEHNDDFDSDSQEDALNFDTYILNRLTELDSANCEIMSRILSRVSGKEHEIKDEVDRILAAELEISAATMYIQSGREFLRRAIRGYTTNDCGNDIIHNPVTGGLDVLRLADQQDKIRSLLDVVDRIIAIRFQEATWWDGIPNTTVFPQNVVPFNRFHSFVDETRRLIETAHAEEVICHIDCLQSMRDRINGLPEVLMCCIQSTFANFVSRILTAKRLSEESLDQYFCEYQTLLQAWIEAFSLIENERADDAATKWTGCVLEVFSFEISKALPSAAVDAISDDRLNNEGSSIASTDKFEDLKDELQRLVFALKEDTKLKSLAEKIVGNIIGSVGQYGIMSFAFFHLCSRLAEIMGVYCALCHFNSFTLTKIRATVKVEAPHHSTAWNVTSSNEGMKTESESSVISSVSSDETTSASYDSSSSSENPSEYRVPKSFEFKGSTFDEDGKTKTTIESVCSSMASIRHPLWKCCESILAQLLEMFASSSGPSISSSRTTEWLCFTHKTFQQFIEFSTKFMQDDTHDTCTTLNFELSVIYRKHLRSVHIDAMRGTGTLLRKDTWQLSPLDLPHDTIYHCQDEKKCVCGHCGSGCSICVGKETNAMKSVYKAVEILVTNSIRSEQIENDGMTILSRSYEKGYQCCDFFKTSFDKLAFRSNKCESSEHLGRTNSYEVLSKEFLRTFLPFIERKACGQQIISLVTQSWTNGLVKWTSRLLNLGNMIPTVSSEAAAAVTTLFDLYILTVFRICSRSKVNEDVLIGLGRGSPQSRNLNTTLNMSITMEADVCAPLPGEFDLYEPLRSFVSNGRENLDSIVNLDKFQSINDVCPASTKSKNDLTIFANKLERECAAAYSCLLAAVLIDVASNNANDEAAIDALRNYSIATIRMIPIFVQQASRSSCVHSISGKELIFQIMCVGRAWEDHHLVEHSNVYVDEMVERCSFLWCNLSTSFRMPPPALRFTWEQLVWVAFMTLLEGFSKVPHCSTEGRSLMSMDLATLSHGLHPESVKTALLERHQSIITTPSDSCREDMMRYVDTFIKVFYFPDEVRVHLFFL